MMVVAKHIRAQGLKDKQAFATLPRTIQKSLERQVERIVGTAND